jgi:hypothetical protein
MFMKLTIKIVRINTTSTITSSSRLESRHPNKNNRITINNSSKAATPTIFNYTLTSIKPYIRRASNQSIINKSCIRKSFGNDKNIFFFGLDGVCTEGDLPPVHVHEFIWNKNGEDEVLQN